VSEEELINNIPIKKDNKGDLYFRANEIENIINEIEQEKDKKIERLNNIIKEVREKIESVQMLGLRSGKTFIATLLNDILKILDKVNNDE